MTKHHQEHLLDRAAMLAMRALLAVQPQLEFEPEARPDVDSLMEKTPAAEGVTYDVATVGGVSGWWCRPERPMDNCAVVYFHGGAYVLGSAAAYRNFVGQIAARANVAIFIADYSVAPERPFPAAVNEAAAIYRGLAASGLSKLVIAGDSSGVGLALALLLVIASASSDETVPKPLAAVVMSPWTDLALTGESVESRAKYDPMLTRNALNQAAQLYLGKQDRHDPNASPLYGEVTGLPPVMFHVGEDEILLDDSRRFANRIEAAGGDAQLHIWEGMTHVFPSNVALHAAKDALDEIGAFLRRQFHS
jgi:monoterpene epsilon-lactone hydrolase